MSNKSTRRSFLALLTATAAAVATNAVAMTRVGRCWTWENFSGWKMSQCDTRLACTISGRRSDGQFFHATVVVDQEASEAEMRSDIENAQRLFDSFLDCECRLGFECQMHKQPEPTPEELAEFTEDA